MSGNPRSGELTTEEALAAIQKFSSAGVSAIFFTGGEPFSREDFLLLLERVSSVGMRSSVITNGTLLHKEALDVIQRLDVKVGISIDGADEATNDAIRGRGSFSCAVKAIESCRSRGVSTTLYVTVTRKNVESLSALVRFAQKYDCDGVHFNEIALGGRARKFEKELALSQEQHTRLSVVVASATEECFGEKFSETDERCWVNGEGLYMTADGNLYVCSEVFQRRSDYTIGNVRTIRLSDWFQRPATVRAQHHSCCYGVETSPHVVLVRNVSVDCAYASVHPTPLKTLPQLYDAFGDLYKDIARDCGECKDPDCMGYIWLLGEEAERLYQIGIPLVQINNGPTFIHSFPLAQNGEPNLTTRYPSCSQLCEGSRRCSIYEDRPLVCRFYPVGLETTADGRIVWAVHNDCLHIRRMKEHGTLSFFEHRVQKIINNISPELLNEIIETYRAVDMISSFPDGENNYSSLQEVHNVQMQGRPGR